MKSKWLQTRTCIHVSVFTVTLLFAIFMSSRKGAEMEPKSAFVTFAKVLHLFCFATWLGVQFWVSFVAGIVMYNTVTRHTFGQLQRNLFPKYFALGVVFTTISIATFLMFHPLGTMSYTQRWQFTGLMISLVASVINVFYVQPLTVGIMDERYAIEKESGYGNEIGHTVLRNLMSENKRYAYLTKTFIKCHALAAFTNISSYAGCGIHLWFLGCELASL